MASLLHEGQPLSTLKGSTVCETGVSSVGSPITPVVSLGVGNLTMLQGCQLSSLPKQLHERVNMCAFMCSSEGAKQARVKRWKA